MTAATTMGLRAADAEILIEETFIKLKQALPRTALPDGVQYPEQTKKLMEEMLHVCNARIEGFN